MEEDSVEMADSEAEQQEEEQQKERAETSIGSETAAAPEDTTLTGENTIEQADTSSEVPTPTPVKRKRGRPPLSATQKPGPTPKRRGRPPTAAAPKPSSTESNDGELFTCILDGKSAMQAVVSEWLERYQSDAERAVLELIQYFVRCCGCHAKISLADFQNQGATSVIRNITENFDEDSFDYPLIMPGPQYKKFKSNYAEFVERLIEGCGDIVFDEYMLDTLVKFLIGLSDSQVRAFRHTSTLACLKLLTGLIHLAKSVDSDTDNTQRQCETERRRSSARRTTGKLSKLEESLSQLQAQSNELQSIMNSLFASVFVRRYRDVCPDVRAICIVELGVWMREYSSHFLADNYLKYIGWTLSDKVGEVRLQSLLALIPLYSSADFGPHLELFTDKFKERFVSMRLDREDSVASAAISLCRHLLSLEMLEPEESVEMCELVYMENRVIGRAAGKFAAHYLFSEEYMAKARRARPPKGRKKPSDAQIRLKELVKFFLELKIHSHAEYIVDSLWEHTDVLQDWETMIEVLTSNSCGIVLNDEEECCVIELLACSVRRAAGNSLVKGKGNKPLSAKEKRIIESDKETLAYCLIPVLPQLITKYGTNGACAGNLAGIPQHFELEIYVELRAQKHLEDLLSQLRELIQKHSSSDILEEIALTYSHLMDIDFTLHSVVDVAFSQLVDELFSSCNESLDSIKELPLNDESNDEVFSFGVTLQRLAALYKQVNMTKWPCDDKLYELVELGIDGTTSDMLVIPALNCLVFHLLWSFQSLDSSSSDRTQFRLIRSEMEKLIKICSDLVKLGSSPVQQQAYVILCDLLIAFGKQLGSKGDLGALVYTADSSLQTTLSDYVFECVFSDSEMEDVLTDEEAYAQAEKLSDRRSLLAGYLKLVLYSAIETSSAVRVLAQYVKFPDYSDLLRHSFTQLREADPVNWYRSVLLLLQHQYMDLKTNEEEEGGTAIDYTSAEWADLKDLAHRIGLTTGFDLVKCRLPIVGLHHEGIKFVFQHKEDTEEPPDRLDFLEILAEFSFRLLDVDKNGEKGILAFLQEQLDSYSINLNEVTDMVGGWESLGIYLTSLTGQEGGVGGKADPQEPAANQKKKGRGPKRKQPLNEGVTRATKSRKLVHEE